LPGAGALREEILFTAAKPFRKAVGQPRLNVDAGVFKQFVRGLDEPGLQLVGLEHDMRSARGVEFGDFDCFTNDGRLVGHVIADGPRNSVSGGGLHDLRDVIERAEVFLRLFNGSDEARRNEVAQVGIGSNVGSLRAAFGNVAGLTLGLNQRTLLSGEVVETATNETVERCGMTDFFVRAVRRSGNVGSGVLDFGDFLGDRADVVNHALNLATNLWRLLFLEQGRHVSVGFGALLAKSSCLIAIDAH
jgi:hypothetical protein